MFPVLKTQLTYPYLVYCDVLRLSADRRSGDLYGLKTISNQYTILPYFLTTRPNDDRCFYRENRFFYSRFRFKVYSLVGRRAWMPVSARILARSSARSRRSWRRPPRPNSSGGP